MARHTSTPWSIKYDDGLDLVWGGDTKNNGNPIAVCEGPGKFANAAFIVRAVNSHDALVSACKAILIDLSDSSGDAEYWLRVEAVKATIAKATGK